MDLGRAGEISANQGIYNLTAQFNQHAQQDNKDVIKNYSNQMELIGAKEKVGQVKGDVDEGKGVYETLSKTAKIGSNAINFDSEMAGFGKGSGVSGYLNPFTQKQIFKSQLQQGKATIKQALNKPTIDLNDPKAMGLQRVDESGAVVPATANTPIKADMLKEGSPELEASSETAKASGGVISDVVGGATETKGVAKSLIGKIGSGISDMPIKQLGAIADIGSKGIGMYGAVSGIADLASGHADSIEKAKDIGDIVSGGLDTLSMAMPVLAPIAGISSVISGIMDITDEAKETAKKKATAKAQEVGGMQEGLKGVSLSSAGQVASTQVSSN